MSAPNKPVVRLRTKSKSTAAPKKITITKADDADEDEEMTMTLTPTESSVLTQAASIKMDEDNDDDMPVIIASPVTEKPAPVQQISPNTPEQKVILRRSFVDKTTLNLSKAIADDSDATTIITSDKPSQATAADNEQANDSEKQPATLSKNTSFKVKKLTSKMPVMANLPSPELMQQQPKKQPPALEKKHSMPFNLSNLPTNQSVSSPKPAPTVPTDTAAKETTNNANKTDNNASSNINNTSTASPALQIAPIPNEIILLHDGSAPSIILPSQEQQLPTYMMTHILYLQSTTTVASLPTDEAKDMYPSDEDEDFEYYLQAVRPKKIDGEDDGLSQSSMARLQGMLSDMKEESLKFVSYVKNPLYDHKIAATPQPEKVPILSKDEVMRLNEVARRCRELGDVNFVNYMQIQQVDKQLQKEYQKKALSRRLSTISGIRRGSVMQNKGIGIKDLEEFRNSDASLDESTDSPQTHRTHQGKSTYDIKTCSKSWKSQMKNLQDKGILDRKASASNAIFPIAPYPFPSCASVSKAGYMPEWRYVLQTKRLLDAKKSNALVM